MRRYLVLSAALLAAAAWSSNGFGRDRDNANGGNDAQASSNDSANNAQADQKNNEKSNEKNNERSDRDRDRADETHHAILGVSMTESDGHVRVTAIMPGSPAARAGVQVNDEIRAVDDQKIRTAEGLTEEIGQQQPGSTVELSIRRNGERRTLQARLASQQELYGSRTRGNRWSNSNEDNYAQSNRQGNSNRQDNWNRNRASSYDPSAQADGQSLNQQLRQLRQQVAQLQGEVDDLRNQSGGTRVGYRNRSTGTTRDGNERDSD